MRCEHGGKEYKPDERFLDRESCMECYCLNHGQVTCRPTNRPCFNSKNNTTPKRAGTRNICDNMCVIKING